MTDVDLNSDLLHKLASARRTVMQMCHDRGYQVNEEDMTMTLAQFKEQFGDRPMSVGSFGKTSFVLTVLKIARIGLHFSCEAVYAPVL
eukprot:m.115972 g.115972  ORF g.115972 m.115972 type:complete len:88 (-) comp13585_c0_seq15:1394-1657(-)